MLEGCGWDLGNEGCEEGEGTCHRAPVSAAWGTLLHPKIWPLLSSPLHPP